MSVETKKTKAGGARPGAGRHRLPPEEVKIQYGTRLPTLMVEFLRSQTNTASWLEAAIKKMPAYKKFVANHAGWEKQS